jgi:hypothetical protein
MFSRIQQHVIILFLSLTALSSSSKAQVHCGSALPYLRIDTLNVNLLPVNNAGYLFYTLHLNWDTSTSIQAQAWKSSYYSPVSGTHSDAAFNFLMMDTNLQVGITSLIPSTTNGSSTGSLTGGIRLQANASLSDTSTIVWSNVSSVPINSWHYSIFSDDSYNFYDKYLPLRKKYGNQYLYGWILATSNGFPNGNNSYPDGNIIYQVTRFPKFTLLEDTVSCSGTYTFSDGLTLNNLVQDTVYDHLFSGAGNAYDSLVRTRLHVLPIGSLQNQYDTICHGNLYVFPDGTSQTVLSNSLVHVSSFNNQYGCDSLIYTYIQTYPVYQLQVADTIDCETDYLFPDGFMAYNIHQNMIHTSGLFSSSGCDSSIETHLYVRPSSLQIFTSSICSGSNYTFPDGTSLLNIVTDTVQESHFLLASGCDSVIETHLSVQPIYFSSSIQNICYGSNYTFPDGTILLNIVADTVQQSHLQSAFGCDSVLEIHLMVKPNEYSNISQNVCYGSNHTFPDGTILLNIVADTVQQSHLQSAFGCDSVIETDLSVKPIYFSSSTQNICYGSNYTFPDGTTLLNIVADTIQQSHLQSIFGCDSVIETHLIVQPIYLSSSTHNICYGSNYTFPDGTALLNIVANTVQQSHFLLASGCDSVIETHLIVQPIYLSSSIQNICYGSNYTFPNGTSLLNIVADTVQQSHLQSIFGCDSVIETHLIVQPIYLSSSTHNICYGSNYTFPDGTSLLNIVADTVQQSHLQTTFGCDSILETHVMVQSSSISYPTVTICSGSNYTFPDGTSQQNIVTNAVHLSHLQSVFGCDSDIITTIQVHFTDTSVQQSASALIALANGVQYQWWNCDSQQIIPGATQYIFHASHAGHYAVIINDNICTDTSSCYTAYNLGIQEPQMEAGILVYPNPTHGLISIRLSEPNDEALAMMKLYNTIGNCVKVVSMTSSPLVTIDLSDCTPGIYYLKYKQWVRKICIE